MAARNTADEIKVFWEPPESDFDTEIGTVALLANRFVNAKLQGKLCADDSQAITEAELKDVELFLTCYFLSTRKPQTISSSVLGLSNSKQGAFSFAGMMGNTYGQMAIELDCTGVLRDIVAKANAAAMGNVDAQSESSFSLLSDAGRTLLPEES